MSERWQQILGGLASRHSRHRPMGSGTCNADYHVGRKRKRSLVYRLRRRTDEVLRAARRHGDGPRQAILDIGTADGLMLSRLGHHFPQATCLGLDLSWDLLRVGRDGGMPVVRADASALPAAPEQFDLVVATAVIEHVPDPLQVLVEIRSCLRPGGLVVLTTPDPFWEQVATLVGHLPKEQHFETLDVARLAALCECAALQVVETRRFMLSPVGLPFELAIEDLVRTLRLERLFANQLVAARRPNG